MTEKQIENEVNEINQIADSPDLIKSNKVGYSLSIKNFRHNWYINNNYSAAFNRTIKIDTLNDAIEIVSKFSGEQRDVIEAGLRQKNKFNENEDLYLHYQKDFTN